MKYLLLVLTIVLITGCKQKVPSSNDINLPSVKVKDNYVYELPKDKVKLLLSLVVTLECIEVCKDNEGCFIDIYAISRETVNNEHILGNVPIYNSLRVGNAVVINLDNIPLWAWNDNKLWLVYKVRNINNTKCNNKFKFLYVDVKK